MHSGKKISAETWHIVSLAISHAVTPGENKLRHKQSDIVTERILQICKQCFSHFLYSSVLIEALWKYSRTAGKS